MHLLEAIPQIARKYLMCLPCFCVLMVILCSGSVSSQTPTDEQTESKPLRFDLTPIVGYRTGMSFPTGEAGQVSSPHLSLDAKPSYGMAVGVRLDEEDLIEFRWARQDTRIHLQDVAPTFNIKAVMDQFHGDFTHEYIVEEWPHWARPFVVGASA
jgi:hypothetical protein